MARHPEQTLSSRAVRGPAVVLVVALALVTAGCAAEPPDGPSPTADPSTSERPTPSQSTAPREPELVPDGNAYDNLPLFTAVTEAVWASPGSVSGRAYIDALVAAGFDKAAMEVTADRTTIDNPVESIMFSVQWDDGLCLVGQVGPTTGDPVTAVFPVVEESGCLIGETRPIDW